MRKSKQSKLLRGPLERNRGPWSTCLTELPVSSTLCQPCEWDIPKVNSGLQLSRPSWCHVEQRWEIETEKERAFTIEKQRTEAPGRKDSPGWNCSRVESGTDSDSQDFPLTEVNQPSQESRGIVNCQENSDPLSASIISTSNLVKVDPTLILQAGGFKQEVKSLVDTRARSSLTEKDKQVHEAVWKRRKLRSSQEMGWDPSNCEGRTEKDKPVKWLQLILSSCLRNCLLFF